VKRDKSRLSIPTDTNSRQAAPRAACRDVATRKSQRIVGRPSLPAETLVKAGRLPSCLGRARLRKRHASRPPGLRRAEAASATQAGEPLLPANQLLPNMTHSP
jgi:hypothetical protein